jgi:hypothetical protein
VYVGFSKEYKSNQKRLFDATLLEHLECRL